MALLAQVGKGGRKSRGGAATRQHVCTLNHLRGGFSQKTFAFSLWVRGTSSRGRSLMGPDSPSGTKTLSSSKRHSDCHIAVGCFCTHYPLRKSGPTGVRESSSRSHHSRGKSENFCCRHYRHVASNRGMGLTRRHQSHNQESRARRWTVSEKSFSQGGEGGMLPNQMRDLLQQPPRSARQSD